MNELSVVCAETPCSQVTQVFAINADPEGCTVFATTLSDGALSSVIAGSGGGINGDGMVVNVTILDFAYTVLASGAYEASYACAGSGPNVPRYVQLTAGSSATTAPVLAVGVFAIAGVKGIPVEYGLTAAPGPAGMPSSQAWVENYMGITVAGVSIALFISTVVYKRSYTVK